MEEVAAVARAEGARADADVVWRFTQDVPAGMTSSMQRDAAAGQPTELDAIGGAVLRAAERHGVDVPVTRRIVEELRARPSVTSAPGQSQLQPPSRVRRRPGSACGQSTCSHSPLPNASLGGIDEDLEAGPAGLGPVVVDDRAALDRRVLDDEFGGRAESRTARDEAADLRVRGRGRTPRVPPSPCRIAPHEGSGVRSRNSPGTSAPLRARSPTGSPRRRRVHVRHLRRSGRPHAAMTLDRRPRFRGQRRRRTAHQLPSAAVSVHPRPGVGANPYCLDNRDVRRRRKRHVPAPLAAPRPRSCWSGWAAPRR